MYLFTCQCVGCQCVKGKKMSSSYSSKDDFLTKLTEIIETNLTNSQFGVSMLARELNMSRSNLHRKVNSLAKISVSQFINQVRLKKAKELLRHTSDNVSDVAYKVGFNNVSYFIKCFHKYYSYSPGEIGKRDDDESNSTPTVESKRKRLRTIIISAIFVVVAAIALFFVFKPFTSKQRDLDKSIAVLPFEDISGDGNQEWLASALTDEILEHLDKVKAFSLRSRTSVQKYRDHKQSIPEIGKELKVNYIVEGQTQLQKDIVRIRVQLIDAKTDNHIWSEHYDREWEEIFDIQSDIAKRISQELKSLLSPEEIEKIEKKPTVNLEAYTYYRKAHDLGMQMDSAKNEQAIVLSKRALDIDPNYVNAIAGLASSYSNAVEKFGYKKHWIDTAYTLVNKAVSIDPDNAKVHHSFGYVYGLKGLHEKAIEEYHKVLEINPKASGAVNDIGLQYEYLGRYDEAARYYLKSNSINPIEIIPLSNISRIYLHLWDFEKAKQWGEKGLELGPEYYRSLYTLYLESLYQGNYQEALEFAKKIEESIDNRMGSLTRQAETLLLSGNLSEAEKNFNMAFNIESKGLDSLVYNHEFYNHEFYGYEYLGYIYWNTERKYKAVSLFNNLIEVLERQLQEEEEYYREHYYYEFRIAGMYALQGNKEAAYLWLGKIVDTDLSRYKWAIYASVCPLFETIRDDDRFKEMISEVRTEIDSMRQRLEELETKGELMPTISEKLNATNTTIP